MSFAPDFLQVWVLLPASALCVACAGIPPPEPSPPAPPAGSASAVDRFLPLRDGFVLSYWVWTDASPEHEQVIFRIERRSRERASLRTGGRVQRLELVADGVRLLSGGYLLRAPLALGAEWTGPVGRVRVTALDERVDVGAGRFVGCLQTTEQGGDGLDAREIVTTFCPDVGITQMRVEAGDRVERFELRSYGPSVDVGAL
jgi:hypothetical protein